MKISIITITYNSAKTLATTLESVANQDYPNIEHIIVDGLSKDDTIEIVQQFPHISKWVSEKDKGLYDALNKGIKMATGDIVGLIHSDDFYPNNQCISNIVTHFEANNCDALYGDLVYVNPINIKKVERNWKSGDFKKSNFLYGWMPPHPSFFVKKIVYEKFGAFNTSLKSAADYEIMLRYLYKCNVKVSYLKQVLVHMRTGGMSNASFKNRIKANLEDRKAWDLNEIKPFWFTLYLKPLRKISQFFLK